VLVSINGDQPSLSCLARMLELKIRLAINRQHDELEMNSAILCELSCVEFFSKEFTHPRCSFIFIAAKLEFLDTRDIITDIKIKVYTRASKNAHGVERVSSIKQGRALDGYRLQNASPSLEIFFCLCRFAKTRLLSGRRDAG